MKSMGYTILALTAGVIWINSLSQDVADAVYENNFWILCVAGVLTLFSGMAAK